MSVDSRLHFYSRLAHWWPLISPVADYAEEAAEFERVLADALPEARTALELGSGGGHNAFYLKQRYAMVLTDLNPEMLEVSRALNPGCEHVAGDMRTLALDRVFDIVFVHDAISYMTTETDLAAAMATAATHCRPGGIALFVPDELEGTVELGTESGGSDAADGSGIRFLEWTIDPDPSDQIVTTLYTFVTRDRDGTVHTHTEAHDTGLFSEATWLRLLADAGFVVTPLREQTDEDRTPRTMFLARKPLPAR